MNTVQEALGLAVKGGVPTIVLKDGHMGHLLSACLELMVEGVLDGRPICVNGMAGVQGVVINGVLDPARARLHAQDERSGRGGGVARGSTSTESPTPGKAQGWARRGVNGPTGKRTNR